MIDNVLNSGSLLKNGEYRIEKSLGQGGFGITYEAEQVSLRRKVAIKEFFMKEYCERDGGTSHVTMGTSGSKELVSKFKDKFIREARMIAGLDHEHIVKIHDVFEENGTAYYVMEFLGGGSLDRKIKDKGAMSESVALDFIRQVASALESLHSQNILHFDIKPSNVLLGKNGSAKLIDFGISKHYDEAGVQTSSTPVGISKGYAPLEQYQQGSDIKSFTPATDIYSLGATLFALLAGSNPPEASVIYEDGLPVIDGVSPKVMHAIEKAMQPRRKDRPQSVAEFLAILDGTAKEDDDEQTVVPDLKSEQTLKNKPEKKPFPKWLYGLVAGVAVAVLAAVLINRPDSPSATDNLQADSTAVVAETVPQKPVTNQSSASASKPETPAVVELKSIALSKTTLEIEEGQSATLTVKYNPSNATDKSTTWKSSNSSVAKVSTNGKVTAVRAGSAAIVARCGDKDAYCNVTVKAKEVQPSKQEAPAKPETPTVIELKSISLSKTTLELEEGSSATLTVKYTPNNATDKTTTWKSSDASVVKVSTNGKVTAVRAGSAAIIVSCQGKDAYCNVTVRQKPQEVQPSKPAQSSTSSAATSSASSTTGTHAGHEWVDLGLSVKWATCNVGASSPKGYGSYFAWGETSPKSDYSWENLKYRTSGDRYDNVKFSKYVAESKYGAVDSKTTLELSDDAARSNWGGSWRMPTSAEQDELIEKCTWTWTTQGGHNGYKVVSKVNGNSIFLPAAGIREDSSRYDAGSYGLYWSSSLDESYSYGARYLSFNSDSHGTYSDNRSRGRSVRPVLR